MMRIVMDAVSTAAMLVTMVRTGSSGPVGLMMNQKSMLAMLTIKIACHKMTDEFRLHHSRLAFVYVRRRD